MRNITFVVTTNNHNPFQSRNMFIDFCFNNGLRYNHVTKAATRDITGDVYLFRNIRNLEDAHGLAGYPIHSYIHLEPFCLSVLDGGDKDRELQHYLLSRLRRPEQYHPPKIVPEKIVACTCMTKTNDIKYHDKECAYRKSMEPPKPPVRKFGDGFLDWIARLFKSSP